MHYLTEKEFLLKGWTEEEKLKYEKAVFDGINRRDSYSSWYETLTPLALYLHGSGYGVNQDGSWYTSSQDREEVLYLESERDFSGNYFCEGKSYCRASFWNCKDSNLDLWTIHLGGTDDCSHSWDVVGEDEARLVWGKLLEEDCITYENTKHFYFSN